jgi:hypothetical protein
LTDALVLLLVCPFEAIVQFLKGQVAELVAVWLSRAVTP